MSNISIYPFGPGGQLPTGIAIVNDLITGGADKALSAEMGKVLNGSGTVTISVDLSDYGQYDYGLNSSGTWSKGGSAVNKTKCVLIPLANIAKVNVAMDGGAGYIAFLKTGAMSDGGDADISDIIPGRIALSDEDDEEYNVPTDAAYLYVTTANSSGTDFRSRYDITLTTIDSTLVRKGDIVDDLNSNDATKPLSAKQGAVLKGMIANAGGGNTRKIFPVTKYGESRAGTITTVYSSEYCILDVTKYQGRDIIVHNVHSANGCSQIKDGSDVVLATFAGEDTSVGLVTIPATAVKFVISNSFVKNPDFFVAVPEDLVDDKGLIFGENFLLDYNEGDFSLFNGSVVTDKGLQLSGTGAANGLAIDRVIPLDNWSLVADILTEDNTEAVSLGTKITQPGSANHSTRVDVNFGTGTMAIYNNSTNNQAVSGSVSSIVSGNIYTLKLERVDRAIKATLLNRTTGTSVSIESPDGAAGSGNEGINPGGKMFDSPIWYVGSGTPYLQNLYATCLRNAKVFIVGDSITAGAHTTWDTSWAPMAAAFFGNSLTGGRGSGHVICCLNELRSLLPVVKPKAVVVTIGTNYDSNVAKSGYVGLFKSIINVIKAFGAVPVINNVCACDARNTGLTIINEVVNELKQIGCRFDLATSINNDWEDGQNNTYYYTDKVHLNVAGNTLLYNIITTQLGWLKNL